MATNKYPGVSDRVKAVVTDSIVLVILISIISYVFSMFDNVSDEARMIAFIFVFFLYDPLLTSFFGGTIGHYEFGIRVRRESNDDKNILLPLAIFRFIFKAFLGLISLLTVSGHEKRKAIHDIVSGSVVVYSDKDKYLDIDDEEENEIEINN